jgi:hypothetical protein
MKKPVLHIFVFAVATVALATEAFAGRRDREGFNFGTSFGYETGQDRNFASDSSSTKSNVDSSSSSVSPYIGVVISDYFNLGISSIFRTASTHDREHNLASNQRIERDKQVNTKAVSLFTRFLFGETMFFELGAGLYDQSLNIHNEYLSDFDNGAFNGQREDYTVRGIGTGYHMGGGVEIPINRGFYFTSSYIVRVYNLRNYRGNGDLGAKVGYNQKRDISFGLSHYVQ